jgi:hypothetical protein
MHDAYLLGITHDIREKDNEIASLNEIRRGHFVAVFEVSKKKMHMIEALLRHTFEPLHIQFNGGTGFFKKEILPHIKPYLKMSRIRSKQLSPHEIEALLH